MNVDDPPPCAPARPDADRAARCSCRRENSMTRPTLSVIGLAIAAVLSANAQAQQADAGATTLDTVIVTGT
ncbi:hypothetical protein DB812_09745, partial [Xanthomonas perforans]